MSNLRDIRRRIKSVKNTKQITRAMQLVAAAKMKKAQDQAIAGRRYAQVMNKVLAHLQEGIDDESAHPLMEQRDGDRELMVVISTDRGLCGALNTNLNRMILKEAGDQTVFVSCGNKGRQTLTRLNKTLIADFRLGDVAKFAEVKQIAKFVVSQFQEGKVDRVKVAFTNFVNTLRQEPYIAQLLPVEGNSLNSRRDYEGVRDDDNLADVYSHGVTTDYLFEPSSKEVFERMVPHYINYQLYQMVLEARASEHSARMVAMKSATDNASSLIKDLTLEFNKLRQANITAELLEITTAMKALE